MKQYAGITGYYHLKPTTKPGSTSLWLSRGGGGGYFIWLAFVMASRGGERRWSDYDIIEGGIANDRVFNTIELYFNGLIDKGEALKRLSYEQPNNQICLLNQSLIDKYLHFIDATNINKEERNDVTSQ